MAEKTHFNPDKVVMKNFQFVKEQIESPFDLQLEHIERFMFDMAHGMGFNFEEKLIKLDLSITINALKKNEEQLAVAQAKFELFFIFEVQNLNELVGQHENDTLTVDPALGSSIIAISYSTARGLLLARTMGTLFSNCIMPIINTQKMMMNS